MAIKKINVAGGILANMTQVSDVAHGPLVCFATYFPKLIMLKLLV
jgi:hypothetical protein